MNKNIAIGVLVLIIAGGAYYMYSGNQLPAMQQADTVADTGQQQPVSGTGKHGVSWKFEGMGEDASGTPQTRVTVVWDGVSHNAGIYMGTCAEIDGTTGTLQEGEVSGALCWWAGSGDELGVFNENGTFVLKHGEQQEPSAESNGFRGNFRTLITL